MYLAVVQGHLNPLPVCIAHPVRMGKAQYLGELFDIDQPVSMGWGVYLVIAAVCPRCRMLYNAGAYHVEVDIDHATGKMIIGLHGGRVIPVFPVRTLATFSVVELFAVRPATNCMLRAISPLPWSLTNK